MYEIRMNVKTLVWIKSTHVDKNWDAAGSTARLNTNMSSYQYLKAHRGKKFYLHDGISYTGKMTYSC